MRWPIYAPAEHGTPVPAACGSLPDPDPFHLLAICSTGLSRTSGSPFETCVENTVSAASVETTQLRHGHELIIYIGDVLYFNILGSHMMVLGNSSNILELLDKRSANTSSRDHSAMGSLSVSRLPLGIVSRLISSCHQYRSGFQPWRYAVRAVVEATQAHFLAGVPSRRRPLLHAGATKGSTQIPHQVVDVAFKATRACALVSIC